MLKQRYYYLIHLQFLGFRYHGWQKQPDVKTVQHMLDRTLNFILQKEGVEIDFKTLGASRTDAMVSAHHHFSQLFTYHQVDSDQLLLDLNKNLPADIRALKIEEIDKEFNIIGCEKLKEYHYYFSYGPKAHPFCAPFLINYQEDLDIPLMQKAAELFQGTHNFKSFCYRPSGNKQYERTIDICEIVENNIITASFFPKKTFYLKVIGKGFLHHQIRLMMGALIQVGQHQIELKDIVDAIETPQERHFGIVAPSSGLHLIDNKISD